MQEFDPSHYAEADRREANPPIEVESATWSAAGQLDWWVRERREWFGRVRGPDGRQRGSRLMIFVWRTDSSFDLSLAVNGGCTTPSFKDIGCASAEIC